ncbi:hypothetical protein K490DRAFT_63050 [Saccharata proteae CBS 121410]|uniref:RCC1/BLIP-II protein n=1 Tax=Saccharata proteae CBS 121410 TaxID=1314787 RepID=A0A9P4HYI8_9PEZI|nr:hypothetical protein K490DRAFT_63050 [Saccharata proteae CBS 121410]
MRVLACGFNGHGQLSEQKKPNDLYEYQEIALGNSVEVVFAGWSQTVIRVNGSLRILGHASASNIEAPAVPLHSFFGDDNGLHGAVGADHQLYLFKEKPDHREPNFILWSKPGRTPNISHVAIAGNGTIAMTTTTTTTTTTTESTTPPGFDIHTFSNHSAFLNFFRSPSSPSSLSHHIPTSPPLSLAAGATTFTLHTPTSIHTWTADARHTRFLGRTPTPLTPYDEPHPIPGLEGLFITKIASRGWNSAALSKQGGLYTWPQAKPDESREVPEPLEGEEGEEVHLQDVGEEGDVVDFGVGVGHVVLVMGDGRVFGIGEEGFGRLGLGGEGRGVRREWVEVEGLRGREVEGVVCGELATFVTVRE